MDANLLTALGTMQNLAELVGQEITQTADTKKTLTDAINKIRAGMTSQLSETMKEVNAMCDTLISTINDELTAREDVLKQIVTPAAKESKSEQ